MGEGRSERAPLDYLADQYNSVLNASPEQTATGSVACSHGSVMALQCAVYVEQIREGDHT